MFSFDTNTLNYLLQKIKENFATVDEMDTKVDKVSGKSLSTNNFTDADKENINKSFDDVSVSGTTLTFYGTSINGTKTEIKTITLNM